MVVLRSLAELRVTRPNPGPSDDTEARTHLYGTRHASPAAATASPPCPARSLCRWRRLSSVHVSCEWTQGAAPLTRFLTPQKPREPARHTLQTVGSPNADDRVAAGRGAQRRGSALTFRSAAVPDVCAATQWPTSAARSAAPLSSARTQAVRICCHHGDTGWASHASSTATAGEVQTHSLS